jgi:hypothetical protein
VQHNEGLTGNRCRGGKGEDCKEKHAAHCS